MHCDEKRKEAGIEGREDPNKKLIPTHMGNHCACVARKKEQRLVRGVNLSMGTPDPRMYIIIAKAVQ